MFKNPGGDDCILAEVELFHQMKYTLRKTNIAPENRPSQKESSLPTTNFQGRAVSFREIILRVYHLSPNCSIDISWMWAFPNIGVPPNHEFL